MDERYQAYFHRITSSTNDQPKGEPFFSGGNCNHDFKDRYSKEKFNYISESGFLAIFYRIPKKGAQTTKTSPRPSGIGIFGHDDKFIGACDTREMKQYIVDGRKVTYIVVDFGAMLLQQISLLETVPVPLVYKFTVKFLIPASVTERIEK